MITDETQNYLSPLTVDAKLFLKSLEILSKSNSKEIDNNLYNLLDSIVNEIGKLLERSTVVISETKTTKLVPVEEIDTIVRIYNCSHCNMDLGKDIDRVALHLVDNHPKLKNWKTERRRQRIEKKKEEQDKMMTIPNKVKKFATFGLIQYFKDSVKVGEKLKKLPEYGLIENELMELLRPLCPDTTIKFYKFGSRLTGIGNCNSDLDIYIDIGNKFLNFDEHKTPEILYNLDRLGNVIRKRTDQWIDGIVIRNARVPIIKVVNQKTRIHCDINVSNSLGICNTLLIDHLFDLQPIARRMSLYLKKWLEQTNLTVHVTTYSIILMVLFYLQIQRHLPSVEELQRDLTAPQQIGPWIGNFLTKSLNDFNIQALNISDRLSCKLIQDFFIYFANFDYQNNIICPYYGCAVKKTELLDLMPLRYKTFIDTHTSNDGVTPRKIPLNLRKVIVVQDPIELNHNVCKSINKFYSNVLPQYFKQTADVFAALKI